MKINSEEAGKDQAFIVELSPIDCFSEDNSLRNSCQLNQKMAFGSWYSFRPTGFIKKKG